MLARLATSLAEQPTPVVLVLDRAEVIDDRAIAADLDLLLQYSSPGLRLVVVGRSARLVPLYRYRLTGELAEIGADDLALTLHETAEVLRAHAVRLSDEDCAALYESTEGWMTAVCLQALAIQSGGGGGYPHPAAGQAVIEFLRREILDAQPGRVRDMLLRTSIVGEVEPDLADRLTGRYDARATLDELVRVNAFVQKLDDARFRYHNQFREMLGDEVTTRHPDLMRRLHGQAARWYAERQAYPRALDHAVRIGDWEYAAEVAVSHLGAAWLLTAPEAEPCRALLDDLPPDQPGPAASLLRAVLALARYDTGVAREAAAAAAAMNGHANAVRLGIATVRAVLGRLTGDPDTAEAAAAEVDALWSQLPDGQAPDAARTRAVVLSNLGVAQFWAGRHAEARGALGRAAASTEPGTEYAVHDALAHLAMLQLSEGKLHQAEKYARESLAVAERAGLRPSARVGAASVVLASVTLLWDDLPAVREHMSRVVVSTSARRDPPTATAIALLRARAASGRLDGRRSLAAVEGARASLAGRRVPPAIADWIELSAIRAHLVLGDTASARRCLDRMGGTAERALALGYVLIAEGERAEARRVLSGLSPRNASPGTLQYAALARGRLAFTEGDLRTATAALQDALEYARPEQRRRPFVESGTWVGHVLRQNPVLAAEHAWLTPRADAGEAGADPRPILEPLTDREIEVLRRLAHALSTEDIAEALYLSVNTVKTHLKSIYRKLGASGRSAATRRARELKLLPAIEKS
jgi:LuxR family maltose regulon positive regulatory protein